MEIESRSRSRSSLLISRALFLFFVIRRSLGLTSIAGSGGSGTGKQCVLYPRIASRCCHADHCATSFARSPLQPASTSSIAVPSNPSSHPPLRRSSHRRALQYYRRHLRLRHQPGAEAPQLHACATTTPCCRSWRTSALECQRIKTTARRPPSTRILFDNHPPGLPVFAANLHPNDPPTSPTPPSPGPRTPPPIYLITNDLLLMLYQLNPANKPGESASVSRTRSFRP